MADHEVFDADIWVGDTPPLGAQADDFWFDTSNAPLFGIDIKGPLHAPGPPALAGTTPGDAWWDDNGHLWVWQNGAWKDQGSFQGPAGPPGPVGDPGPEGQRGEPGAPLRFVAKLKSSSLLPTTGNSLNDAYVIGRELVVWDGTRWEAFPFVGPQGVQGPPGPPLRVIGSLVDTGPPPLEPKPVAGDTWLYPGGLLVWDGGGWFRINGATGRSPQSGTVDVPAGGSPGDVLSVGADGRTFWAPPTVSQEYADLEARVQALEMLVPALEAWIMSANWSPDGVRKA